MIKMYNFNSQYKMIKDKIDSSIQSVLNDSAFSSGKYVQDFENKFSNYIGSQYCVAVNNGTSALHAALLALDIKPGDEVLVPSFSFFATCESVSLTGATPVFVDSDYQNFNLDLEDLESKINSNTKAIICVHLYGQSCDMNKLKEITNKYNLYLIEDAAQAHGAEYNGKRLGSIGDVGCFSFYPTKNLGAIGDGGALVTSSNKLAEKIRLLREYGWKERYISSEEGLNSRLDELQAAILNIKLNYLDEDNSKRNKLAKIYFDSLKYLPLKLPETRSNSSHVFHLFVIRSEQRNKLKDFLQKNCVHTTIQYPVPIHKQEYFQKMYGHKSLPFTEEISRNILSLPMFPELSDNDIHFTIDFIRKYFDGH